MHTQTFLNFRTKRMESSIEYSLWSNINKIISSLDQKRLADVFRFISFDPFQTYGPHHHQRIEINFVRKGSCILHLNNNESITFSENEMMIIYSGLEHKFEAGVKGTTLMQLEFMPEIFEQFNLSSATEFKDLAPLNIFSKENKLIKIVDNVRMMRSVQRIVNELKDQKEFYKHLVVMYYAELLILIYRHMSETYLPLCSNTILKNAIGFIRENFNEEIAISDVAKHVGIGERYLRKLFATHLNLSPLSYLNQIRINRSIELLKHTDLSIKEIAFTTGFQSPQYFSRIFKSVMGISPSQLVR